MRSCCFSALRRDCRINIVGDIAIDTARNLLENHYFECERSQIFKYLLPAEMGASRTYFLFELRRDGVCDGSLSLSTTSACPLFRQGRSSRHILTHMNHNQFLIFGDVVGHRGL